MDRVSDSTATPSRVRAKTPSAQTKKAQTAAATDAADVTPVQPSAVAGTAPGVEDRITVSPEARLREMPGGAEIAEASRETKAPFQEPAARREQQIQEFLATRKSAAISNRTRFYPQPQVKTSVEPTPQQVPPQSVTSPEEKGASSGSTLVDES